MIIIIKHEKLSDRSKTPTFSIIDNDNHLTLHPIDDEKCSKLVDAFFDCTIDVDQIIDYRWMNEKI